MIRLLALEGARTAESMAIAAREAARRRLSTGHLSRTLDALQKDMDHLTPLIRSLVEEDQKEPAQGPPSARLENGAA